MSSSLDVSGISTGWTEFENQTISAPPAISSKPAKAAQPGTIRIFIADDNDKARLDIKGHLSNIPCCKVIGEATDGASAISEVKRLNPDVVLMKFSLSGIDGLKATQQIKEANPQTRIMILGSMDNDCDIYASFNAGANGYCLRSSPVSKFIADLLAISDGAIWVDPQFSKRSGKTSYQALVSAETSMAPPVETALSDREQEVLRLLAEGMSNQEIGKRLIVSSETVKTHVKHIMEKLAVNDRTLAVVTALRKGIL